MVFVSTDKAVEPSSVMGATKRIAELYVRSRNDTHGSGTKCSLVRFGNVLGSSGSVLEVWRRQIADGGPVTVTDPRMTRYFMTIPEAAGLVIRSATLSTNGGGVFVLDMGEPAKIVDLASSFCRSLGLPPGREAARGAGLRLGDAGAHRGRRRAFLARRGRGSGHR
jgi:FlaA1/EpsC-like NDP-sugar epimerase